MIWGALGTVVAQVTVDAKIDTLLIRIGEQTVIHLQVSADAKSQCEFPDFQKKYIADGVECLEMSEVKTEELNDGKRKLLSRDYLITSFDSGAYYIPPMEVLVDKKPYKSKEMSLKVFTVEVNLDEPDTFYPPKDVIDPPFAWEDWSLTFWLSVLLLPMIALCVYFVLRLMDNKPIIRKIKLAPKLPPHQKAINEIQAIKQEKQWAQEDSKEYYTRLTDTLRVYIKERYNFNATEMTSTEIIEKLTEENDQQALDELRNLFTTADLVKFAKYNTQLNENDMNLVTAVEFINQTKIEIDPTILNKPAELTVEEKRSKTARLLLIGGICLLALACIAALVGIGMEVYHLCF